MMIKLSDALRHVSDELLRLDAEMAGFERDLWDAQEADGALPGELLTSAQAIDRSRQTLEALARYLVGLAGVGAAQASIDQSAFLRNVNLAELAARLSGVVGHGVDDEFEMFV
jgi:hypothetical protein